MTRKDLNTNKKTGFKVPENYFDDLSEKVMNRLESETKEVIPNNTGFKVPQNYFEGLDSEIIDKLPKEEATKVISLNTRSIIYYLSGVAAILLLFFALFPLENKNDELTIDMVEFYFEDTDIDTYELAELLIETDLLELEDITIQPTYDDTSLEDYLLDNADLEQIIIQ